MVYALAEDGPYTPTIPTGKAVDNYTVWYKAQVATDAVPFAITKVPVPFTM